VTDTCEMVRKEVDCETPEQAEARAEKLRQAKEMLGDKWALHPANSPKRGSYHPVTGVKINDEDEQ
jgi:hypothetical protein